MVERIRITGNQILAKNASDQVIFDSNNCLMKVGGGSVYLDGYKKIPVAYGGPLGVGNAEIAGGFLVWSAGLFGNQPQTVERWVPRFTGFYMEFSHYTSYITVHRYFLTPYTQTTLNGQVIAYNRWVGVCGSGVTGELMVRIYPEVSWQTSTFPAGYLSVPWSNYAAFTYTDNGALYQGEFGSVSSFQFGFDFFCDADPRALSYSRTP